MNWIKENLNINVLTIILFLAMFAYGWYQNGANQADFDLSIILTAYGILFSRDVLTHTVTAINKTKTKTTTLKKEEGGK